VTAGAPTGRSAAELARREAELVARLRAAGCVFAEDEARLLMAQAVTEAELEALTVRRVAGEPLEYVLGWAEFRGLRLAVSPGVFVPRTRTGFLVESALAACERPTVVVDLCCGNGAVGAAIVSAIVSGVASDRTSSDPGIELHAVDVDPAAVACARANLAAWGGHVHRGDLFEPLPASLRGRVDLLVANTPYVPTEAIALMPPEAREHEARAALDGGPDGLALLRRIAAAAPSWLAPRGHLLIEIGRGQVDAAAAAYERAGLAARIVTSEGYDATVAIGTHPLPG
jgi:release factor glutamine methyltransferase